MGPTQRAARGVAAGPRAAPGLWPPSRAALRPWSWGRRCASGRLAAVSVSGLPGRQGTSWPRDPTRPGPALPARAGAARPAPARQASPLCSRSPAATGAVPSRRCGVMRTRFRSSSPRPAVTFPSRDFFRESAEDSLEIMDNLAALKDAREKLLDECENMWSQMEECQSKLRLLRKKPILNSDGKLPLLKMRMKCLSEEHNQLQNKIPEVVSSGPDVLLSLGQDELQKVKSDLEILLSTLQSKNEQLDEDLKR
ncbi:uncharacterized protein LJ264_015266 [Porphyrio hochstetteri]